LLLHGVIHDDNPTNNGETFIIYLVEEIIIPWWSRGLWYNYL